MSEWDAVDRAVAQAAERIGGELEKLAGKLPPKIAPQAVMGLLAIALRDRQPTLMRWLDPANAPLQRRPRPRLIVSNKPEDK